MAPENYLVIYQNENGTRIFVLFTTNFGDFVLTKNCKGSGCGCLGCLLFTVTGGDFDNQLPVLNTENKKVLKENLIAYPFTDIGGLMLHGLKHKKYKKYKGTVSKLQLDKIFRMPDALLFVKKEQDDTFTHSYLSPTFGKKIISRGCKSGDCPCIGCRIVDMISADERGEYSHIVDRTLARTTSDNELVLPIYSDNEEIISKLLNKDPSIRHDFFPNIFDSPLEKIFYELAFLDLHLYPQYKVGKYRVDFALPDKKIAIELDGHDYHKTKFQRTNDAKRDRWLYGEGWHVLRFTGSEIHRDIESCIDEICNLCGVERFSNS
ncbi:endonuclease domain-containing protein [Pectobacterium brasiliense]|uniref:endonuclease domain-containing protein n=1 Tax=Pectobacterium brasiliense TaxID=180957 RepID=UPI003CF1E4BA